MARSALYTDGETSMSGWTGTYTGGSGEIGHGNAQEAAENGVVTGSRLLGTFKVVSPLD